MLYKTKKNLASRSVQNERRNLFSDPRVIFWPRCTEAAAAAAARKAIFAENKAIRSAAVEGLIAPSLVLSASSIFWVANYRASRGHCTSRSPARSRYDDGARGMLLLLLLLQVVPPGTRTAVSSSARGKKEALAQKVPSNYLLSSYLGGPTPI